MNTQRAKEIAQSPDMKNVVCNGERIYIQHVNDQSETARVFPLDQPEKEYEVQVADLTEM
ncbi:small acid-soluble spore protein H [Evansella sp. AB-rgal1]|uniref:small acid-soluble spore protein H n=1 Tax=Evansella sp. AB-rgal1 TaxID=3242696 RepID=UPI00359D6D3E